MKKDTIYLAGGCFWGMQAYFEGIQGVLSTKVGYANANRANPKYEDIDTDYAETVEVVYDKDTVPLSFILDLYFDVIDPTIKNRQGNDIGRQYRTGIYYTNNSDNEIIRKSLDELQKQYSDPIVVEYQMLENFYTAEEYHQNYLKKHPSGYCHIGKQKINKAHATRYINREDLRKKLTLLQYHVTQENGTETPFENEYFNYFEPGIYVDVISGDPLFLSSDKFESGCGWPAFSKPINNSLLVEKKDRSHGMIRTEIRSTTSDSHLGHLFYDGPIELGGYRYCINSASLRFVPLNKMREEGYGEFIPLLKVKNK